MQFRYKLRIWHVVLGLPLAFMTYDYWSRYSSWSNLSKQELVDSANWYVRERAQGGRACLYAVVCGEKGARLELVKNLDELDMAKTKDIIWKRRFRVFCPGRTSNFALELEPGSADTTLGRERAVWSFFNDRFVPVLTRFSNHAFSEIKPEPCSAEHVITGGPNAAP